MDLHGGMPVNLEPSKTANITYLFTNLVGAFKCGKIGFIAIYFTSWENCLDTVEGF